MDLRKGLSYLAYGFLFTLININLTINQVQYNITPDFIGWILFFLACDKLGGYTEKKPWLKWLPLAIAVMTCALWLGQFMMPDVKMDIVDSAVSLLTAIYMFLLFGSLEELARDIRSPQEGTVRMLKYLNIGISIGGALISLLYTGEINAGIAAVVMMFAAAALVAAILTAVTLFKLRNELN